MNVLDLFSGIGGFSFGLERAGMRTVAFCEIEPYCQRVLRRHWPDVAVYGDVRELTAAKLAADAYRWRQSKQPQCNGQSLYNGASFRDDAVGLDIDVICGGFPCQDISVAGKGAGLAGERSGLWSEYARIIGEVRPRYVIVENVAALLSRGLGDVLGDLAALGFDAEWHCIPASAVGAPHRRDRLWIIADNAEWRWRSKSDQVSATAIQGQAGGRSCKSSVADAGEPRLSPSGCGPILRAGWWDEGRAAAECGWWSAEPDVGRVAHGVPARVDRLRALGNAIVPQIAEVIGRAIMSIEREEYDGDDDFSKSIAEAYRVIRERKANGGPGWGGWE
jgi:DNA (cytosine-5)-methyltransferase 1